RCRVSATVDAACRYDAVAPCTRAARWAARSCLTGVPPPVHPNPSRSWTVVGPLSPQRRCGHSPSCRDARQDHDQDGGRMRRTLLAAALTFAIALPAQAQSELLRSCAELDVPVSG